jgi:Ion channel
MDKACPRSEADGCSGRRCSHLRSFLAHIAEAAMWAAFFWKSGHLVSFSDGWYLAGVSHTTLGYGDVVLPKPSRSLGPIPQSTGCLPSDVRRPFSSWCCNSSGSIRYKAKVLNPGSVRLPEEKTRNGRGLSELGMVFNNTHYCALQRGFSVSCITSYLGTNSRPSRTKPSRMMKQRLTKVSDESSLPSCSSNSPRL